ncbi:MAG: hypothetical protein CL912_08280 [Deltaproteobacteria bacterium]|nr:hypothetical protein [Deltaproteobacteria bacterium]
MSTEKFLWETHRFWQVICGAVNPLSRVPSIRWCKQETWTVPWKTMIFQKPDDQGFMKQM